MPDETADPHHAEIEARLEMVVARTSQTLNEADRDLIRKQIVRALELREGLRAVVLENHDEAEHGFDPAAMHVPVRATSQVQRR